MKIQLLEGNLGNQIREYVFVRYAQRSKPGEEWVFDDSVFFVYSRLNDKDIDEKYLRYMPLTYELDRIFGLKVKCLSQLYSPDEWAKIIQQRKRGIDLCQILLDLGENMVLFEGRVNPIQIQDAQAHFSGLTIKAEGEHLGFHPEYIDLPYENIYYHAEWASRKWFDTYAEDNRKELQFPPLRDEQNLKYAEKISNSYSVGIHVRRGDFTTLGWHLPAEAYRPVCQRIVEGHTNLHFFIFSDDLDWCKANKKELGLDLAPATYVSGNIGENSYRDMQLLSMCNGMIRNAESSFSQVAGWLNPKLEFDVKISPVQGYPFKISTYPV